MDRDAVDALLDTIDGALRDYGTSNDAMRWQPADDRAQGPVHRNSGVRLLEVPFVGCDLPDLRFPVPQWDPEMFRPMVRQLAAAFATTSADVLNAVKNLAAAFAESGSNIAALQESADPPMDSRERALQLRRARNTGPVQRHRPPRRVDPTKTR